MPRLLLLSNGHGEDTIGAALVPALRARGFALEALPIVGLGQAYTALDVPIAGPTQPMPSGGFVYGRPKALAGDLSHGLVGLTLAQLAAVRAGDWDGIVAIGDVVVLAFAWLARKPYVLVGCAKSDYYLGGRPGSYLWHERALLRAHACRAVYPRDGVTTANLAARGVRAVDLGNPMMDGLESSGRTLPAETGGPTIVLLPGSRAEARRNFLQLAEAAAAVAATAPGARPRFLVAVARDLADEPLVAPGWRLEAPATLMNAAGVQLHLLAGGFADAAQAADLALGMAGTATEQLVGLGKPVITLAGAGPQFTRAFAEAQTRLLGSSVCWVRDAREAAATAWQLLADPARLASVRANGLARMGPPGASQRIASAIAALWLDSDPTQN